MGKERKPNKQGDVSWHPDDHLTLYVPPQQRQKWGDTQVLPRTNYSDLFFDLFYVALAYNAANILNQDPSGRGLLYFVGVFFPAMDLWLSKTFYDARFAIGDDLFHRIAEMGAFIITATVILHIRSVDILSNQRDYVDMFVLTLTLALVQLAGILFYAEIYFKGVGQREILKIVSVREFQREILPLALFSAAAIFSGIQYYVYGAGSSDYNNKEHHRMLAGDEAASGYDGEEGDPFQSDIPIYLCLAGTAVGFLYCALWLRFFVPRDGALTKSTVPINIEFVIHRNGEWIMLMLGESVLALLIVEVIEGQDYYITFFCGLLTVVLLQYYHYRSQPNSPDQHALRRDKNAGIWFTFFMKVYSAALVCVGTAFKLFLYDFTYEAHRRLVEDVEDELSYNNFEDGGAGGGQNALLLLDEQRFLAGGGGDYVDPEVRQQRAADLFCGAMAIVWFCSDILLLLHTGLKDKMNKCRCKKSKSFGLSVVLLRTALIVWMATLSQYVNNPEALAVYGMVGVMIQLGLRKMGGLFFPDVDHHDSAHGGADGHHETGEEGKWPNVTHAAALHDRSLKEAQLKKELAAESIAENDV